LRKSRAPLFIESQDAVNAPPSQPGNGDVVAEEAVGQENVALFEMFPQGAEELKFVAVLVAGLEGQQGAAGQRE